MQIIVNDTDACWAEVLDVVTGMHVKVGGARTERAPGVPAEQYFNLTRDELDAYTVLKEMQHSGNHTPDPICDPEPAPVADTVQSTLDAQGIPWDQRIHASSKAKTADGNWRVKRNVTPELVAQITAELKGVMGLPAAAPAPVAPVVPAAPPAPVAPPPPPAPAPVVSVDPFNELMTYITGRQVAKTLSIQMLMQVLKDKGFNNLMEVNQRHDLIGDLRAALELVK